MGVTVEHVTGVAGQVKNTFRSFTGRIFDLNKPRNWRAMIDPWWGRDSRDKIVDALYEALPPDRKYPGPRRPTREVKLNAIMVYNDARSTSRKRVEDWFERAIVGVRMREEEKSQKKAKKRAA